jgi:hypothetical protein
VVFLYVYSVCWCNSPTAALEENLRRELDSKNLENLELKNSILELTLTKSENDGVLLITGVIFVVITV